MIAASNQSKKSRICAHADINKKLHEMFISHQKGYYVRPHRHLQKSESILILKGEADLVLFDEQGDIKKVIQLENYDSANNFYDRIDDPIFHTIIMKSKSIFCYEAITGPFNRKDTEYAKWAPEANSRKCPQFFRSIESKINNFSNI